MHDSKYHLSLQLLCKFVDVHTEHILLFKFVVILESWSLMSN